MSDDMPKCTCGKLVKFWSALDDQGYCSDDCYCKARGYIEPPAFVHNQFDEEEACQDQ